LVVLVFVFFVLAFVGVVSISIETPIDLIPIRLDRSARIHHQYFSWSRSISVKEKTKGQRSLCSPKDRDRLPLGEFRSIASISR
jgi:hypothetical protein